MARQKLGWALAFCVVVLKPLLTMLTRRDWRDADKLPSTGGCVLVANHVSHVDPLTYAHFVYDSGRLPRYLAKSGLFKNKLLGWFLRSAHQIPVFRASKEAVGAYDAAVAAVEAGECVVVYPEGTITRDPNLWPMVGKTGAARIALSTGAPVIPTAPWGPQRLLAPYAKKPSLFPRKLMQVRVGDPVELDDLRDQPPTPMVLREATDRIMAAITVLLGETRGEVAPTERFDPAAMHMPRTGNPNRGVKKESRRHVLRRNRGKGTG